MSDLTLWDLEETLVALLESEATVTSEQEAEYRAELGAALKATVEKRDRVAAFLRFCSAQCDAAGAEIERLKKRQQTFERAAERLREQVLRIMVELDMKKLEGNLATFSRRANLDSVIITDAEQIPARFKVLKTTESIDKRAIKKAIDAGEDVPGADIAIGGERLEVR